MTLISLDTQQGQYLAKPPRQHQPRHITQLRCRQVKQDSMDITPHNPTQWWTTTRARQVSKATRA